MNKYLGKTLDGRYEVRELIGIGGMADVYKAFDLTEQREVAVKILKEEFLTNEDFKRRFRNESKAIAVLSHPNIVKVFDVSFGNQVQYIVMECVDGITLKEYIEQQGIISWKEGVHFTVQILRALQHAHDNGIVHRDVKPQNVMLLQDGTVKVMDFGIARFARDNGRTISDKAIGSVHYISPEQARGDITDERTDIYSIGVLMYEIFTGGLPFDGETPVSIAVKQMQEEANTPRSMNPEIPIGLEEIVVRAMKKDPDLRYQTAAEMLRDIDEFKRNPNVVFEYKYFTEDTNSKYFDAVSDDDDEGEVKKRMSPSMQVLMAVAAACAIVAIAAVIIFFMAIKEPTKEFKMYNLVGLKYEDIIKDAKYDNIRIVKAGEEMSSQYEAGLIIEQTPKADTTVKEKSKVSVTVSSGMNASPVPDVAGKSKEEAKKILDDLKIELKLTFTEEDSEREQGVVTRTDPVAETSIKRGAAITVYYSSGKSSNIVVPELRDLTQAKAEEKLTGLGLKLGDVTETDSKKKKGTIVGQGVASGTKVSKGTAVSIQVSNGKLTKKEAGFTITFSGNPANTDFTFTVKLDGVAVGTYTVNPATAGSFSWNGSGTGTQQVVVTVNGQNFAVIDVDFDTGNATTVSTNPSLIQGAAPSSSSSQATPSSSSQAAPSSSQAAPSSSQAAPSSSSEHPITPPSSQSPSEGTR